MNSIGDHAFYNCSSLVIINYRGTEEQWEAIFKGDSWSDNTGDYSIVYNYTSTND